MSVPDETRQLLQRWHQGERAAIDALIARDLPWIRDHVHARLGPLLRARGETMDYLQDAILDVLHYTPRFVTDDRRQFRALVARIVENHLRDAHDHHAALRRTPVKERPVPSDSVLDLGAAASTVTRPDAAAERNEQEAWVRLALELLEPADREVLLLRQWQGLEFAAVGERLGIAEDAARMRFQRALPKLARQLEALRAGKGPLAS
ncbi:MAG: sigma-70 family RNA polymerase sigma factor [Planctomycetes bacterium]|jgi:RNA polymerase sigma-70 factor (ECF subfamily)|nr:sigma-70 family RNA polymerase sigma factor [Planctomycetota bacterium]